MGRARAGLICLALSWLAAVTADHALRTRIMQALEGQALAVALVLFITPFIILAPLNAYLANRFGVRRVTLGAAAARALLTSGIVLLELFAPPMASWYVGLLVLHLAAAASAAALTATIGVLPAAAEEARVPVSRLMGGFMCATAAGVVGGSLLAERWAGEESQLAPAIVALYVFSLLMALPLRVPSERRRLDSLRSGVQHFDLDARLIARSDSYGYLKALMLSIGFAALVVVVMLEGVPSPAALFYGLLAGFLLTGLSGHPRRVLGWIPFALTGLVVTLLLAGLLEPCNVTAAITGLLIGLLLVSVFAGYLHGLPATARPSGAAVAGVACVAAGLSGVCVAWMVAGAERPTLGERFLILSGVAVLAAIAAWRLRFRESLELFAALIFLPVYRIRAIGPGVGRFPLEGPVLVVANHAAWFDPLWLGKVIPRRLTPLMVSRFYDLPVIRWLVGRIIRAIRVQESNYRQNAPELAEAVARLDRGECVVVFPEGMLRRSNDELIRRFGQGVWHILSRRPDTPVVACWIEGGWGSFTSYWNGPPGSNKRFDWFRPITIVMDEPREVSPAMLGSHRQLRDQLGKQVLSLREFLMAGRRGKGVTGEVAPAPGEKNGAKRVSP